MNANIGISTTIVMLSSIRFSIKIFALSSSS